MAKPLGQFGGWLKFFYVMQWITLFIWSGYTLLFVLSIFGAQNINETIESFIAFFDGLITLILCIKIVKAMKKKDTCVPNQIVKLMTWLVLFTAVFALCKGFLYYFTLGIEGLFNLTETGRTFVRMLIWYAIWTSYFKKSVKVRSYYGSNADKLNKIWLAK